MTAANQPKIYVAGHRGMVGSAIVRSLHTKGYTNVITATRDQLDLLDQKLPDFAEIHGHIKLKFEKTISLCDVSFEYKPGAKLVVDDINFEIQKGSKVGLIGITGSGKSTVLDIIMGLLSPTKGHLKVDNTVVGADNYHLWHLNIAHVPQTIFLSDATVAENIAMGVSYEDIDFDRLNESIHRSQLFSTIESLVDGYNTLVGERGVRLSGGQRQRIGIARALYKNADVIIFDEATSALDDLTENEVMDAIDNLRGDLTVIIVAHRLSTLKNCSRIIEIEHGKLKRVGSFEEIIKR